MCEEPPTNDKLHVEVLSRPPSIGIHSKVLKLFISFTLWCPVVLTDGFSFLLPPLYILNRPAASSDNRIYLFSCLVMLTLIWKFGLHLLCLPNVSCQRSSDLAEQHLCNLHGSFTHIH